MKDPHPPEAEALAARVRSVVANLRRRLREQGSIGDLSPSQTSALKRLELEGVATVAALARAEGLRPQSMGTVIAALEGLGLVQGAPDPGDRRQVLFSLTPECVLKLADNRAAHQDWLSGRLEHLDPREQAALATALRLLEDIAAS